MEKTIDEDWERQVHVSAFEIARLLLEGELGNRARGRVLDLLDISDEEADILQERVNDELGELGCGTLEE